jgi:4-amino-4-deoxy-L-arabinose transferase-like glycosyltransferase
MGKFVLPTPHHAESFERIYTVMKDGRWYSIYPPGHAMLLAVGVLFHIPQWVNPVSSGGIVILSYRIAKIMYGMPAARLTLLFFMVSPFFVYMGAGWMNHPTALLFAMLFWYGLISANKTNGWRFVLIMVFCGFAYGMLFLTRPVTALAFLIFGMVWVLIHQNNNIKQLITMIILFALGTTPLAVFYLYYNTHTTGSPLLTGYVDYFGGNPLGFGKQPWGAEPLGPKIPNEVLHTPLRGLANTICNLNGLNYYLFGFPVPSLLFVAALFLPGMKRRKEDWLCILPFVLILFFYFFYFFQDYCFGPRFVYEAIPFLCMLSARGVFVIIDWIKEHTSWNHDNIISGMIGFVIVCMVCSFSVVWVERYISMSQDYWSTRDEVLAQARQSVPEDQALFFTELGEDFAALFSVMDPRLDRGWIVAHDLGEAKNQAVIKSYPNVPVYSVHLYDDETRGFITVIEPYTKSVIGP